MRLLQALQKVKFRLNERQKHAIGYDRCLFEGFDFMVINLALPFITRIFNPRPKRQFYAFSSRVGTLLAFFVVRLADRWGRRPIFLWSVILYSFLSLITVFRLLSSLSPVSFCPCPLSSPLGSRFYHDREFDPK